MTEPNENAAQHCTAIAKRYERHALIYPTGSLGRMSNLADAAKYHDLAQKFSSHPGPGAGVAQDCSDHAEQQLEATS